MRRKYESEEKPGVALEGKRGKGKARAQACTPDSFAESMSSAQYQTTTSSFSEGSRQSTVQPVLVRAYPAHAAVGLDVYEVRLSYCLSLKSFSVADRIQEIIIKYSICTNI
jgi:hypothetical protein